MRSHLTIIALVALPCACVIDGVPLPDETNTATDEADDSESTSSDVFGIYATLSSGVTLVFGVPGTAPANATIVVLSGARQAQTASSADGSFNLALIGDLATTIDVRILVGSSVVAHTTLEAPQQLALATPDGDDPATSPTTSPVPSTVRVDDTTITLDFPAGSFVPDVSVAVVDLDRGTTEVVFAAHDGSLSATISADEGDTLYVVAVSNNTASTPYVVTAP